MAERITQAKPDPAIAQNIRRARRGTPGAKAKGLVVGVSLAATLLGWAVFSQEDTQTAALQAATPTRVVAAQQTATTTTQQTAATTNTTASLTIPATATATPGASATQEATR